MIRVGYRIPHPSDGTSYYRGLRVLAALAKQHRDFSIHHVDLLTKFSEETVLFYDVVFFQRPSTPPELQAIEMFKDCGIPVVVDYDDNLFEVPMDNPAHATYADPNCQATVASCISVADAVIVSTVDLKRSIQLPNAVLNERVFVVPNAVDDVFVREPLSTERVETTNTVLWRGTATHERDIVQYQEQILKLAESQPDLQFKFAGYNPWFLTERMAPNQAIVIPPLSVGDYMRMIKTLRPKIGIVPLHDSNFNRCKSNIALLEMAQAGAACLVPDWVDWRLPGAVAYTDRDSFYEGLHTLMQLTPQRLADLREITWTYIANNLTLSKMNLKRAAILKAIAGLGPMPSGWEVQNKLPTIMQPKEPVAVLE